MKISYQLEGRCLWHEDCQESRQGIIKSVEDGSGYSKVVCLDCGKSASIPIGFSGCKEVDEI